jgi:glycosyltransferase involved in cell wall biosynthesis
MARIGINPARGKLAVERPQRITITMVTYLPELSGYFEHRLEVLRLSLASLTAHTSLPHDLMIFDNGSCAEALQFLQDLQARGELNYLIRSEKNVGKIDALRILFNAAPGEIIAYSDDDILFYPGWLEAHLQILEAFPQSGMVSGAPVRNAAGHAHASLDALAAAPPAGLHVERRRCIPDEWEADWAQSTGREPQAHLQATSADLDLVFRQQTPPGALVEAIGAANHFQFIARKERILAALPSEWTGKLMGSMIEMDEAIDRQGGLRLSTMQRYTRHLGNALSPEVLAEARRMGLAVTSGQPGSAARRSARKRHPLLGIPGARRVLSGLYRRLFDILYR